MSISADLNIRTAAVDDLPLLNQISVASKNHWGYPDEWMQRWQEELQLSERDLEEQNVWVLEVSGEPIGFCAVLEHREYYEVTHLWVLPACIGRGYGKLLLGESIARTVKQRKKIRVEADPHAEAFYQSQGFVTVDKVESEPKGRFLPVMERVG